jgi:hypothetical protein
MNTNTIEGFGTHKIFLVCVLENSSISLLNEYFKTELQRKIKDHTKP